jgi:hypothetical protein
MKPLKPRRWELPVVSSDEAPGWTPAGVKWAVKSEQQLGERQVGPANVIFSVLCHHASACHEF